MESEFERDPLAGFAFRTTGYNSISALTARLNQYHALTGGKMAGMTCNLVLRAKSTAASMRQAIFYTDIEPRESLFSSVAEAKRYHADCHEKGINLAALDAMVLSGHAGEPYSEPEDEDEIISSEFYPDQNDGHFQDSGHQNHGGYPANNAGENHGQNYGNGNNQTHDDQQFDENEEPSQVLQEVLQRISMIQDISAINAGKIWIQNRKDFKSEFERNRALQAIHNHFLTLQKAA
jgi:hypothetical protein